MSASLSNAISRKEQRFPIQETDLQVLVHRHDSPDAEECITVPIDLSSNGIKIIVESPLNFEEKVELEFFSESKPSLNLRFSAEVRWFKEYRGNWVVGCATEEPINEDFIHQLCIAGGIERRGSARQKTELDAEVQVQGKASRIPVTLLDFSDTGIRFTCKEEVERGQYVKLILRGMTGESIEFTTLARWSKEYDGGHMIGAELLANSQVEFRKTMAERAAEQFPTFRRRPWLWASVAAAVMLFSVWSGVV